MVVGVKACLIFKCSQVSDFVLSIAKPSPVHTSQAEQGPLLLGAGARHQRQRRGRAVAPLGSATFERHQIQWLQGGVSGWFSEG